MIHTLEALLYTLFPFAASFLLIFQTPRPFSHKPLDGPQQDGPPCESPLCEGRWTEDAKSVRTVPRLQALGLGFRV